MVGTGRLTAADDTVMSAGPHGSGIGFRLGHRLDVTIWTETVAHREVAGPLHVEAELVADPRVMSTHTYRATERTMTGPAAETTARRGMTDGRLGLRGKGVGRIGIGIGIGGRGAAVGRRVTASAIERGSGLRCTGDRTTGDRATVVGTMVMGRQSIGQPARGR